MRTTLTLDDDLERRLKTRASQTGRSFKEVVNAAIRQGLGGARVRPKRYRLKTVSLGGVASGIDLDKALRLAEALEEEAVVRKLELRK